MGAHRAGAVVLVLLAVMWGSALAQGPGPGGGAAPVTPPTPQAGAPIDLAGYWVAIVSEDWRWRMMTPAKGDYASIPLTPGGLKLADTWDPARDEAAGEQCRGYGAPGVMRGPTRLHITWLDADTLKLETDFGRQTRLLEFGKAQPATGPPTWQGVSTAEWVMAAAAGRGESARARRFGSMKSVTRRLRPGYLRKNGVPYSGNAVFTEFWDLHTRPNGDQWMVVTNTVDDPVNLQIPWITSLHFKKERDGSKWDPTPCSAKF